MPETKLITVATIKQYVALAATLPDKFVDIPLNEAQTAFVRPLLGDELYEELLSETDASSLTAANTVLVNKLTPYLSYRAVQTYFYADGLYSTPMGYRTYKEENSDPISTERRTGILRHLENMAETELQQVVKFLRKNKEDYPLWPDNCDTYDTSPKFGITPVKRDRRRGKQFLGDGKTYRRE